MIVVERRELAAIFLAAVVCVVSVFILMMESAEAGTRPLAGATVAIVAAGMAFVGRPLSAGRVVLVALLLGEAGFCVVASSATLLAVSAGLSGSVGASQTLAALVGTDLLCLAGARAIPAASKGRPWGFLAVVGTQVGLLVLYRLYLERPDASFLATGPSRSLAVFLLLPGIAAVASVLSSQRVTLAVRRPEALAPAFVAGFMIAGAVSAAAISML